MNQDTVSRLRDIQVEMLALLDEAYELLPKGIIKTRAESYWYPHIKTSLTNESQYLGRSMCSLDDTIEELEEEDESWLFSRTNKQPEWFSI